MATHSSILACRVPWTEEPGLLHYRVTESDMIEATQHARMHGNKSCCMILILFINFYSGGM